LQFLETMRFTATRRMLPALALVLAALGSASGAGAEPVAQRLETQRAPAAALQLLAQARAAAKGVSVLAEEPELREIERQFIAALKIAPRQRVLRGGLAGFYREQAYSLGHL